MRRFGQGQGQGQGVHNYLESVTQAIETKNGLELAKHLKKTPDSVTLRLIEELRRIRTPDTWVLSQNTSLDADWKNTVGGHLLACLCDANNDHQGALKAQNKCIDSFHKIFKKETNWLLPALYTIVHDLKTFASKADAVIRKQGGKVENLEGAVRDVFMPLFRTCLSDSRQTSTANSKVMAGLRIVNYCFASYYELNTISLCKNLIKTVEGPGTPPIVDYPISQQVTYYYYRGKLTLFGGEYRKAQVYLKDAFNMCKRTARKNKQLLLLYLIPVEMLLGRMPSLQLLRKYSLKQLVDIASALKSGDLRAYRKALQEHEDFFISRGLYMIMEKLRMVCFRNFFKKVASIVHNDSKNRLLLETHVLPLLHWLGETDVDIDEVECITANLIFNGFIKGYISHKHRCVVLSNKQPFPPISSLRIA